MKKYTPSSVPAKPVGPEKIRRIGPGPWPRIRLVGTIHGDPLGFCRLAKLLRLLRPGVILVELSPFGLNYRKSNRIRLLEKLFHGIREAPGREAGLSEELRHQEIRGIRRQQSIPFEYLAARFYARKAGIPFYLADSSRFSRTLISYWDELVSPSNISLLLSISRDRPDFNYIYNMAAAKIMGDHKTAFQNSITPDWNDREVRIAARIKHILRYSRGAGAVYIGGANHLAPGNGYHTIRDLLGVELCNCYLLDRGRMAKGTGRARETDCIPT